MGSSRLGALLAALLAVATFAGTVRYGFVYDDRPVVAANPAADDPADWRAILLAPSWGGAAYRPLTIWTFALNHGLHGAWPGGYHAGNVALHALVSALVVIVAVSCGATPAAATIAGVLFATHPVHTEAVASIVGRAELLCAVWMLAAILTHIGGARRGWRPRDVLGVLLCVAAGLLSKEYAATLVLLLPLVDLLVVDGGSPSRFVANLRLRRALVYTLVAGVTGGWLLVRHLVSRHSALWLQPWMNPLAYLSAPERMLAALDVQARALGLLFVPHPLRPDYSAGAIPLATDATSVRALLGIAVAVSLMALATALARRQPRALFWLLFAGVTWGVVSNLVVPSWVLFAERLVYLPSVGFCVLAALGLDVLARGVPRRLTVAAVVIAIAALWMNDAWRAQRVWRDDLTLARAMVTGSPGSAHAHNVLGRVYAKAGRLTQAMAAFDHAIALAPESLDSFYDAALVRRARGRHEEARRLLRRLLRAYPSYFPAAVVLAATEIDLGHPQRALSVTEHALWYGRDSAELHVERAIALEAVGRPAEARMAFGRALHLAPGMAAARLGLERLAVRDSMG